MKIVVSLISEQGGSGKTTVALNLAKSLAQRGVKTVVVDFSPQNSIYLRLKHSGIQAVGIADIIINRLRYGKKFIQKQDRNMGVLVNGLDNVYDTVKYEDAMIRSRAKIAKIIDALSRDYDVVIIDTAAGVGRVTQLAMGLSTHLLVVTGLTDNMSVSTASILEIIKQSRYLLSPHVKFVGILLNRLDRNLTTYSKLQNLYYHWSFFLRTFIDDFSADNSLGEDTCRDIFDTLGTEFLALIGYNDELLMAEDADNDVIADKLSEVDYCTTASSNVAKLVHHRTDISNAPSKQELNDLYRSEKWTTLLKWAVDATGMQHGFILDSSGLLLSEYNSDGKPLIETQESVIRLGNRFRESATDYIQFNIGDTIINVLFLRVEIDQQHATELFQICLSGEQVLPIAYRTKIVKLFAENIFE